MSGGGGDGKGRPAPMDPEARRRLAEAKRAYVHRAQQQRAARCGSSGTMGPPSPGVMGHAPAWSVRPRRMGPCVCVARGWILMGTPHAVARPHAPVPPPPLACPPGGLRTARAGVNLGGAAAAPSPRCRRRRPGTITSPPHGLPPLHALPASPEVRFCRPEKQYVRSRYLRTSPPKCRRPLPES